MRTIKVITSQHKPYYDLIGKDCIVSFLKHWPKNISMELWAEDFLPDEKNSRIVIKDFHKINPRFNKFVDLVNSHTDNPKVLCRKKFWLKGHVVLTALEECKDDVFLWLDSDVITLKDIPFDFINNLIDENTLSVDIPAGGKVHYREAETGFFALNMRHPLKDVVIDYYRKAHTSLEILNCNRYMETGAWANAVKLAEAQGAKTSHLGAAIDHITPFMHTVLKEYMRHWVDPKNKSAYVNGNSVTKEELL
jgi:hypothetical protein